MSVRPSVSISHPYSPPCSTTGWSTFTHYLWRMPRTFDDDTAKPLWALFGWEILTNSRKIRLNIHICAVWLNTSTSANIQLGLISAFLMPQVDVDCLTLWLPQKSEKQHRQLVFNACHLHPECFRWLVSISATITSRLIGRSANERFAQISFSSIGL